MIWIKKIGDFIVNVKKGFGWICPDSIAMQYEAFIDRDLTARQLEIIIEILEEENLVRYDQIDEEDDDEFFNPGCNSLEDIHPHDGEIDEDEACPHHGYEMPCGVCYPGSCR